MAFVQKLTCPFIAKNLDLEWNGVKYRKEMMMETVRIWDLSYLQTQQNISSCYRQVCNYWSDKNAKKYFKKVFGFWRLNLPSECLSDISRASYWHIFSCLKRSKRGKYLELGLLLPVSRDPTECPYTLKRSFIKRKISSKERW